MSINVLLSIFSGLSIYEVANHLKLIHIIYSDVVGSNSCEDVQHNNIDIVKWSGAYKPSSRLSRVQ